MTWFSQLLEGLSALHREGIVHLDIKPDNLLIADVNQRLVIADLGYCHQDSYLAPVGKTRGYAAPELGSKGAAIDVQADIYSAGRVLQEMLRGSVPSSWPTSLPAAIPASMCPAAPQISTARPPCGRSMRLWKNDKMKE